MNALPARNTLLPIDTIVSMLRAQIAQLARDLLPNGKKVGNEWVASWRPNDRTPSLKVCIAGSRAGVWADFGDSASGDPIDLIRHLETDGDAGKALAWARQWLGLGGLAPEQLEARRRRADEIGRRAAMIEEHRQIETRKNASRIWFSAEKALPGTPVERYLSGRGIHLPSWPNAIRFHPALYHAGSNRKWPAMVAPIHNGAGQLVAVHRTFLSDNETGPVTKAAVDPQKQVLGRMSGGTIRLWRGESSRRLAEMKPNETLHITEGIEDGLSVATADPAARVIAAVSLSNLPLIELPPAVREIVFWRQNDTKEKAIEQFNLMMRKLQGRGFHVSIPEIPSCYKDVNDWIRGARVE